MPGSGIAPWVFGLHPRQGLPRWGVGLFAVLTSVSALAFAVHGLAAPSWSSGVAAVLAGGLTCTWLLARRDVEVRRAVDAVFMWAAMLLLTAVGPAVDWVEAALTSW